MSGSLQIPPTLVTLPVFMLGCMDVMAGTSDMYVFVDSVVFMGVGI